MWTEQEPNAGRNQTAGSQSAIVAVGIEMDLLCNYIEGNASP